MKKTRPAKDIVRTIDDAFMLIKPHAEIIARKSTNRKLLRRLRLFLLMNSVLSMNDYLRLVIPLNKKLSDSPIGGRDNLTYKRATILCNLLERDNSITTNMIREGERLASMERIEDGAAAMEILNNKET